MILKTLAGHMVGQIKNSVGVAPFIIVPTYNLEESIIQAYTSLSINDRTSIIGHEVAGNNLVFRVTQNSLLVR